MNKKKFQGETRNVHVKNRIEMKMVLGKWDKTFFGVWAGGGGGVNGEWGLGRKKRINRAERNLAERRFVN